MADLQKEPANLHILVVVILAIAGAFYLYEKPFEVTRPVEEKNAISTSLGPQFVGARLWQDPFTALSHSSDHQEVFLGALTEIEHRLGRHSEQSRGDAKEDSRKDGDTFRNQRLEVLQQALKKYALGSKEIIVMPVMVFGGRYVENIEARRRYRYAVLAALAASEYRPMDAEHIGYFQLPWFDRFELGKLFSDPCAESLRANLSVPQSVRLAVPYEWLEFRPSWRLARAENNQEKHDNLKTLSWEVNSQPNILLLWLNDDLFNDWPLARLARLIRTLRCGSSEGQPADSKSPNLSFKIIGPAGSTTLQAMVRELAEAFVEGYPPKSGSASDYAPLAKAEIYSASATASASSILGIIDQTPDAEAANIIVELFGKIGVRFFRTITSDSQLAAALVDELRRRGVEGRDYVAIISEWDTFYGRELRRSFEAEFHPKGDDTKQELVRSEDETRCPAHICRFFYFRGIDGEVFPNSVSKGAADTDSDQKKADKKTDRRWLERSIGPSQLDYLRRLARNLERLDEELKDKDKDKGGITAVGILGSDVYDKLLILQALHDRLPGSLFFTTDLDARYIHPAEYKWTRNLIVASGFGLRLIDHLQHGAPPFRDSYQTSRFFAVQTALEQFHGKARGTAFDTHQNALEDALKPRLFELGRNLAIDISTDQPMCKHHQIHPKRDSRYWTISAKSVGSLALVVIIALTLLWLVSANRKKTWTYCYVAALILTPLGLIAYLVNAQGVDGEPFAYRMGVSMWPTETIRLFAAFLALTFIGRVFVKLGDNNHKLDGEYPDGGNSNVEPRDNPEDKISIGVSGEGRNYFKRLFWPEQPSGLSEYILSDRWTRSVPRILPALTLYFALASIIMVVLSHPPHVPYRGELSKYADQIILIMAVSSLVGLVLIVTDVTRSFKQFINHLIERGSDWPKKTLARYATRREMKNPEDLNEWLTIRFIAERSQIIGGFIYYPFIVLFLMIVSRSTIFDRYDFPIGLLIVIGINFTVVTSCAVMLRICAERARRTGLDALNTRLLSAIGETSESRANQIRVLIDNIKNTREGAFSPIPEQPVVGALLLPFGGIGGLMILEYMVSSYM